MSQLSLLKWSNKRWWEMIKIYHLEMAKYKIMVFLYTLNTWVHILYKISGVYNQFRQIRSGWKASE